MAHLFKLNAAQQQVDRRRAPHIGLGQGLVANHRHTDGIRLCRGVAFALHVTRRDRPFFHFRHRFAGFAVEHKDHALFTGLHQYRRGSAFTVWQIVQQRLRRQIEVPQVVMGGLEMPADPPVVASTATMEELYLSSSAVLSGPEIWRGVTGWQVNQVQFCVIGHCRPDVRCTARVGLAFRRQAGQVRITRIPRRASLPV